MSLKDRYIHTHTYILMLKTDAPSCLGRKSPVHNNINILKCVSKSSQETNSHTLSSQRERKSSFQELPQCPLSGQLLAYKLIYGNRRKFNCCERARKQHTNYERYKDVGKNRGERSSEVFAVPM